MATMWKITAYTDLIRVSVKVRRSSSLYNLSWRHRRGVVV